MIDHIKRIRVFTGDTLPPVQTSLIVKLKNGEQKQGFLQDKSFVFVNHDMTSRKDSKGNETNPRIYDWNEIGTWCELPNLRD